jgi:hypothetical protein
MSARKRTADALPTRAREDVPELIQRFAAGETVTELARAVGLSVGRLRLLFNAPEHQDAYRAARETHADAIYEEIVALESMLREAWDESDHVKVSAIRAEIDSKRWRAARMNRTRYGAEPATSVNVNAEKVDAIEVRMVRE